MIALIILLTASCGLPDAKAGEAFGRWCHSLQEVEQDKPPPDANLRTKMLHLIRVDEITRQNLWMMDDPSLSPEQRHSLSEAIGTSLIETDRQNTIELKRLLPKSGWFTNDVHGLQITHGAWLIAQHSPDDSFREYALSQMEPLISSGKVDARDYALTYDRVQVLKGLPQKYGSQAKCLGGRRVLSPVENELSVNIEREAIGWSQTIEETKGDLEIGKPCAW